MNKNKKVLIVVGVVAVASVFSGAAAWLYLKGDKAVKPEQVSVSKPQETAGSTGTSNNTEADAKQGEPSQPRAPTPSTTEPATGTVTPTQAPASAPIPLPTGTVPAPTPAPSPAPTPMPVVYTYRNGTYMASRSYSVPDNSTNVITTTVTIKNDKVLAISATHNADASNKSLQYINPFESSVCSATCGQSLSGLSPSRIGGASLTTAAFQSALDTIRANARA